VVSVKITDVPPKRRQFGTRLHGFTSKEAVNFVLKLTRLFL
jgi:hypothetical protein